MRINLQSPVIIWAVMWVTGAHTVPAQTRIDLQTQAKSADLSSMGPTKPAQTGSVLPATCSVGEVFFLTSAPAGTNLNVCAGANQWSALSGGSGSGGGVTLEVDGTTVGTTGMLNLLSTSGSTVTAAPAGSGLTITVSPASSQFATRLDVQNGSDNYCASASANPTAYTCSLSLPLAAYAEGMRITWAPDVSCTGGVTTTLAIDGNPATNIYQNDGVSSPLATQCGRYSQVALVFCGSLNAGAGGWRIMSGTASAGGSSTNVHLIAYPFDGGGSALSPGKTVYLPEVPFSCTVSGWSLAVDQGTATVDIWIGPDGTAIPTAANSITGSAQPSITTGTRLRSTAMSGWNKSLLAYSSLAFNLVSVTGATQVSIGVECDQ